MSQGAEATQTLESSASAHTLTIEGRPVGSGTPQAVEVIASYVTSKKIDAVTAKRVDNASATAAGSVTGVTKIDVYNSIHVAISMRNGTASASVTVALALFDASTGLIGITRDYTLTADASYTDGTDYVSPIEIVDVTCASQVGFIVRTVAGTADLYLEAL